MNNASCCNHANNDEEKRSCCSNAENLSCCSNKGVMTNGVMDPVCGMELDRSETKLTAEYKGKTYYFCNIACKDSFVSDPQKYLDKANQSFS
jgi:Cu+-exporting ATPase